MKKYTLEIETITHYLIIIILAIVIVIVLVWFIDIVNDYYESFELDPSIPTVNTNVNKSCNNGTNIASVCINFDNCCGSNNHNPNSQCFCKHPFVSNCIDKYKTCISNANKNLNKLIINQEIEKCNNTHKDCCSKYSSIDIMNSNFKKPFIAKQTVDKICSINGLVNLEQRCMELCQTNDNCKAYSLITGGCNLYNTINYDPADKYDNSIYVIKQ